MRNCQVGAKARRQMPFGPYVADFAFLLERLIVEVDGETHATASAVRRDARRDALIRDQGFRILRFSNREVAANIEGVLSVIVAAIKEGPRPGALPLGERAARR